MKKRILVAPLNWGLGHATRCMPIINALLHHDFEVVLASDGHALNLLRKEFPSLETAELPGYGITYSGNPKLFKWQILRDSPKLMKTIKAEKKATESIIDSYKIDGIISDNRFGVQSKKVPCAYITHQLRVLSGNTTWLSTKMHQKIINQFDVCWVPDNQYKPNLSGQLGHVANSDINTEYLGPLSRFKKKDTKIIYDLMVLLSGPEPQRTFLEEKLYTELKGYKGQVLFIRGQVENLQTKIIKDHLTIYNFMTTEALEKAINESAMVLSRSGYTTIMDLAKLEKKAFFIPTPGQFEQEYLAKRLHDLGVVPSCKQGAFTISQLETVTDSKGLQNIEMPIDYKKLFGLF